MILVKGFDVSDSVVVYFITIPVKEELDEAVPPHELLDVSASRAKGELAARGGLANRHLPSLKKTTSMSSAGSQDHSLDDSSLDDELPESQKHTATETIADSTTTALATTTVDTPLQDTQPELGSRRSADSLDMTLPTMSSSSQTQQPPPPSSSHIQNTSINISINQTKTPQPPPPYSQATMGSVNYLGGPPPPYHPPPSQFGAPRQPFAPSDPSTGLPLRPLGAIVEHIRDPRGESRPEIPYRHPPPVARVQPVNRAEISESSTLAAHLANRTPQQQSLAEQLKALLAERDVHGEPTQRNDRDSSPSKRSPTSLMEDVRQAVLQADVSSHIVSTVGQAVQQISSPNRSQSSGFYSVSIYEHVKSAVPMQSTFIMQQVKDGSNVSRNMKTLASYI
ncbi:hypothetical protein SK128_014483 [Halocaridina rubra]|uniref:Uncharacterized protein n=1 Tax=Halocaridina rubra TaxID=373956 RepID=A0AAN8XMV7_HALRR